jgi:sulfoxide reductase catalytic subunit YedY
MERKLTHIAVPSSEITPESLYLSRREWLKTAGIVTAASLLAACVPGLPTLPGTGTPFQTSNVTPGETQALTTDALGARLNTFDEITGYNNYYEFSTSKIAVASLAVGFITDPWSVEVTGLVRNPKTYSLEDLLRHEQQERVYRLRCVEAWSMVIPWIGFELNEILEEVQPTAEAQYVKFTTLMDPDRFPGQGNPSFPWLYTEGLRLDEAMHPLTILASGLYGKPLPNQDGAPLRLVVPWKYGFKSIKSIVKIELVRDRPETFWNTIAPDEYGFYSNVDHPRWSQNSERRIGETDHRETLMFNGYAADVADLYEGMDLIANH